MKHISLRKGLNLPISGAARPEIDETKTITSVGIIGADYIDLKPRITVAEGDLVSVGTPLMADKTMEEAKVVSPIAGRVTGINRGARRKLISITVTADDAAGAPVDFRRLATSPPARGWWSGSALPVCGPHSGHGLTRKCPQRTARRLRFT